MVTIIVASQCLTPMCDRFRSKAAFASGGSFVYFYHYRKRYVVFDPEVFQNALISEQGTINSVGVCVENRAFKVSDRNSNTYRCPVSSQAVSVTSTNV